MLGMYFDEYCYLSDATRSKLDPKYDPICLPLNGYEYKNDIKKNQIIQ